MCRNGKFEFDLRSFLCETVICVVIVFVEVVSDGLPLVQAMVPRNQTRSFIIPGSDILVRLVHGYVHLLYTNIRLG